MVYSKAVRIWLLIGVLMVLMQVVIGGITRLTGSGLSITKWEIITGTLPPTSAEAWEEAFDLYKSTPQYEKINQGMTMSQFKFIYFWEYFHRLWARMMGLVFFFPFLYFLWKRQLDKRLLRQLGIVVLLAALAASFGWIMVASGLINRPWVNAYKLTLHLAIGSSLFCYLSHVAISTWRLPYIRISKMIKRWALVLLVAVAIQFLLGGLMAGSKAALAYTTWPTMNGEWIPSIVMDGSNWSSSNFIDYDSSTFFVSWIQFVHRSWGYILFLMSIYFLLKVWRSKSQEYFRLSLLFIGLLILQIILGIYTLFGSIGEIPVELGVLHQGLGLIILSLILHMFMRARVDSEMGEKPIFAERQIDETV